MIKVSIRKTKKENTAVTCDKSNIKATQLKDAKMYDKIEPEMAASCKIYKEPKIATENSVPGYDFLKTLSTGKSGFGAVHLYRNNKTRATVKIQQVSYMKDGKNIFNEVSEEIHFMMNIIHPNIATYHDYFVIDKCNELFIVQEYAKRGSLRHMLNDQIIVWQYFSQSAVLQIIRDIICGVSYLNSLKVVLWNLKPENIMVSNDGYMKICDFGPAHDVNKRNRVVDNGTADVRSFSYMAPETFGGLRPDGKSLVWSIGIIFYELCTFEHPFQSFTNTGDLLRKIEVGHYKSLNFHVFGYGRDVQEFAEWMLQANRLKRKTLQDLLTHNLMQIKRSVHFFVWLDD